ncbi:DUF885 domain-containing protein [Lysobacter sp. M2-1]|uniref:DUF885 domain-containing protein n=1 Tax=Lysobacter sp. M2-1 TaxID=2916839 RepID=UPI001F5A08F2|nr:DUF885 domain-containing protein [Lysobacter sp. M2-1]
MKILSLAIALALALPAPLWAQEAAPTATVERATPAWVATSNGYANALLETEAQFNPESVSERGLTQFDRLAADLGPDVDQRRRAALVKAKADLQAGLARERDPNVRQDLQIMIEAVDRRIEGIDLSQKYERNWTDAALRVFDGEQALLQEQIAAARRPKALERLQRYVGLWPQSTSIFDQARARYEDSKGAGKLEPTRLEVEQAIANAATYVDGVRKLYQKYPQPDSDAALAAFEQQATAYAEWLRAQVLPVSRTDPKLPPELYAYNLRQVGIDIAPELLIQRAQAAFMETRAAMQQLAPLVAKEKNLDARDYREVIRALKRDTIPNDQLETEYRKVIDAIDPIIRREKIVDVPTRPMIMRLGTPAESAAQPAPHFRGAQLIGNTGEQGQFVLPLGNPAAGKEAMYDDFNYPSAAWTLSAHEGRPGHELQSASMIERGVSLARALFAGNSVNSEGWALYAEAEMVPYEPLDGQLIALQFRLMRAARAMLDPMLNLGLIDRPRAEKVLMEDVVLSKGMATQELDRYQFRSPGQAGSYFYGYSRIMELRMETELALGERFDRLAFNNFLLDQGRLPPKLLAEAVRTQFIPAHKAGAR